VHNNNINTAIDQRFFFPRRGEAQYHESFDVSGIPTVHVLEGDLPRIVARDAEGVSITYDGRDMVRGGTVPSGSRVQRIAVIDSEREVQPGDSSDSRDLSFTEDASNIYEVQPGDMLILQANTSTVRPDAPLWDRLGREGVFVAPADQPLPFSTNESTGQPHQSLNFLVAGVITADLKLVSWSGPYYGGQRTRDLVDQCIAYSASPNTLELYLLEEKLGPGRSLTGTLRLDVAAAAYLAYFDELHGMAYTPTEDLADRLYNSPRLTREQYNTYQRLGALADRM